MEAIGQLAGGVAHDFNNLLTAISGYCQLAMREPHPASPMSGYLKEIGKATGRAADLTRHHLAFSRRQVMEPRVIGLNELVLGMDKILGRLITESIDLAIECDPGLWAVKVDPGQVEQVIINLAVNARDAMPDGGTLIIETSNVAGSGEHVMSQAELPRGEYVMLVVGDTGTGMAEDIKGHVFEPFFTTKGVGQGTGLGLSTCYGIVSQSGGHMTVDSEPGRGTTFRIYLPRVHAELSPAPLYEDADPPTGGDETVMLVEYDPSVRRVAGTGTQRSGLPCDRGLERARSPPDGRRGAGRPDQSAPDGHRHAWHGWRGAGRAAPKDASRDENDIHLRLHRRHDCPLWSDGRELGVPEPALLARHAGPPGQAGAGQVISVLEPGRDRQDFRACCFDKWLQPPANRFVVYDECPGLEVFVHILVHRSEQPHVRLVPHDLDVGLDGPPGQPDGLLEQGRRLVEQIGGLEGLSALARRAWPAR